MKQEHLPNTRKGFVHKASVGSMEFYMIIGEYPDGRPGELFIVIGKEGSTLGGTFDAFSRAVSLLLQSGWTIDDLAQKFRHSCFDPRGRTTNPEIEKASSIVDYVFTWMQMKYGEEPISKDEKPTVQVEEDKTKPLQVHEEEEECDHSWQGGKAFTRTRCIKCGAWRHIVEQQTA